ncbi:NAD(P)-dependent oxidoreductase [Proteiniphilum sp.]|uniref:2-hydroxyacid dehydrogenase n=1 Tax=Proteiniphilum sp. TaxID=1926877 RepID=UPI00331C6EA2
MKIVVQKNLYDRSLSVFSEAAKKYSIGFLLTEVLDEVAMLEYHHAGADCFIIGAEAYSSNFYRALRSGSLVIRYGVGYNSVPVELCKERRIRVAYTPDTLTDSVAEYTFALLLTLCRHTADLDKSMKSNEWIGVGGIELKGKTIAIIGFGKIGQAVARIAKYGFGMKVNAYSRHFPKQNNLADFFSLDYKQVVKEADIISLHLATTPETKGFFNKERLSLCKKGAILVNTSRGELVVESDLYEALLDNTLGAAALDVFVKEPYYPTDKVDFRKLPNVLLTPHCGSNTKEANDNIAHTVIRNILAFRDGKEITLIPELK